MHHGNVIFKVDCGIFYGTPETMLVALTMLGCKQVATINGGTMMKPIVPGCREQLSADDFEFVVSSLGRDENAWASLRDLLTEPRVRDEALDSDRVFHALLEDPHAVTVSPRLYFYVLVRRVLRKFDRGVADYIATVLVTFLEMRRLRTLPDHPENVVDYVSDMLAALAKASAEDEFHIRAHVGNYTLFMSGIFPCHLEHRALYRGAPRLSFYQDLGSRSYRLAAHHRLAEEHELAGVYRVISEEFGEVRFGLNQMSDRLLCIESARHLN